MEIQNILKKYERPTTAMRQAGFSSSVDRLRKREMLVFKRTIPGKTPARRIAAERCKQAEKPAAQTAHLVFADTKANVEKTKRAVFCQHSRKKDDQ